MNKSEKGSILLLYGIMRSGKTSIAKEIIKISDENYYHVAIGTFSQMINPKYHTPLELYWSELNDCFSAMYSAVNTFAHLGKKVILDAVMLDIPEFPMIYQRLLKTCEGINIFSVNVTCSLDTCIERFNSNGNWDKNQVLWPQWQSERALKIPHDMTVDTTNRSPEECANDILCELEKHIR